MDFNLQELPSHQTLKKYAESFPEIDIASVELCLNFLQTARKVSDAFQVYFSKFGLSEGKFIILMLLLRESDHALIPSELAEKAGVTRGTITGLLDGLEKDDWIKRQHNKNDRRKWIIILTEEGKKRLVSILPEHYKKTAGLMGQLTPDEKDVFYSLLLKIYRGTSVFYEMNKEETYNEK
ncbi:MarR family transcriptional regulator [Bacillus wiedmannii]|uniref:MarR family winged helix-turn-helix transcriptional regulator n=1 Tax=Bacillus wiedmannii TaxID=1890302 RepID=UPI000BFE7AA6|nr:MarR family transcriptional regulator [Bacillus wiedmannii]PHC82963.1 MarR family transcriptional regulator [Bacillus wiedmannii]